MSDAEIREVMRLVHWLLALPEEYDEDVASTSHSGGYRVGGLGILVLRIDWLGRFPSVLTGLLSGRRPAR